jgi:hypothetical protein
MSNWLWQKPQYFSQAQRASVISQSAQTYCLPVPVAELMNRAYRQSAREAKVPEVTNLLSNVSELRGGRRLQRSKAFDRKGRRGSARFAKKSYPGSSLRTLRNLSDLCGQKLWNSGLLCRAPWPKAFRSAMIES